MSAAAAHFPLLAASARVVNAVLVFLVVLGPTLLCARLAPAASVRKWILAVPLLKVSADPARRRPSPAFALRALLATYLVASVLISSFLSYD